MSTDCRSRVNPCLSGFGLPGAGCWRVLGLVAAASCFERCDLSLLQHVQQLSQGRDVCHVAKVVDDLQARFNVLVAHLRPWHQRAVLGIDVGPVDAANA